MSASLPLRPTAIIFDFDGVVIDSEYAMNVVLADALTAMGHPHSAAECMTHYMGLADHAFVAAIEARIWRTLPSDWLDGWREDEDARIAAGMPAVDGAIDYILSLPDDLPLAVASSSSSNWINGHLAAHGLAHRFGAHIYSGREHVTRGKPAPDIYLHAAAQLGVGIEQALIIEDSPVGVTGALASGAAVIGLCAGRHCDTAHGARLTETGVAHVAEDYAALARMIAL